MENTNRPCTRAVCHPFQNSVLAVLIVVSQFGSFCRSTKLIIVQLIVPLFMDVCRDHHEPWALSVSMFENAYSIRSLLYIMENPGCLKTDLYRKVGRSIRMPEKLDRLEEAGLIVQKEEVNRVLLFPTEKGRQIGAVFAQIDSILRE